MAECRTSQEERMAECRTRVERDWEEKAEWNAELLQASAGVSDETHRNTANAACSI